MQNINRHLSLFRNKNWPIFIFAIEHEPDGSTLSVHDKSVFNVSGSEEAKMFAGLELRPHDKIMIKRRHSCFQGTDFLEVLRTHQVTHLVMCGFQLSACVLATMLDAYNHDLYPLVVSDGVLDDEKGKYDYFNEWLRNINCSTTTEEWIVKSSD